MSKTRTRKNTGRVTTETGATQHNGTMLRLDWYLTPRAARDAIDLAEEMRLHPSDPQVQAAHRTRQWTEARNELSGALAAALPHAEDADGKARMKELLEQTV